MKKSLLPILLFPILIFAQENELKKAEKTFNEEKYIESISILENLVKKGNGSVVVYEKLADANYLNANYAEATKWYTELYALTPDMDAEHHYRFALSLKSAGLEKDSEKQMQIFETKRPKEIRTYLNKNGFGSNSMLTLSNVNVLPINSKDSDYSAAIKGDTIVFASARDFVLDNKKYARTQQSYTSLYYAVKNSPGAYSKPKLFSKGSFSIYHEATPVFTKDGKTMYYSQNQLAKKSKAKLVNGLFKIYKSAYINGKWRNQGPIPLVEDDSVRVAHPALSPDGKFLYFSADLKSGNGNSDIYRAAINSDGSFGKIEHLNDKINSEGRETFPFVTEDNTLVFASDGHHGLGGLDLYYIDLNDPTAIAINLGASINSAYDDFALVTNTEMSQGYYTSNRPGANGDDDLYSFDLSLNPLTLSGTITDEETKEVIPNATVVILDSNGKTVGTIKTDSKGNFVMANIKRDSKYIIKVQQEKYIPTERQIVVYKKDLNENIEIKKEPVVIDFANLLNYNLIYFDLDKYFIRKDAKPELDKVVAVMNQYPEIKVEIGSHTDSRESKKYNQRLSQQRADATLNYLVSKGIDIARLTAVGYGETQLVNECKDGVKCSEAEHQLNRRSTFRVIP